MMSAKYLTKAESASAMDDWINSNGVLPEIEESYTLIRKDLQDKYNIIDSMVENTNRKEYFKDIRYAKQLYEYFEGMPWFNLRVASDDGFWRYLSLKVIPDIVGKRWGDENDSHYWKNPSRIWLKVLWWLMYLSWCGSSEGTYNLLCSQNFNTDTILNLVERTGKHGTYVTVYRNIMKIYGALDAKTISRFETARNANDSLFRVIMRLNTAKVMTLEPSLVAGGEEAYVESLFREVGVIM